MTTQTNPPGSATVENPVSAMRRIFRENRAGNAHGIYSVCSAHPLVLDAAFAQASADKSLLLIEATCNQVNQDGGYTGLTPSGFRDYVHSIAAGADYPLEQLILGGDHLGPNPWRSQRQPWRRPASWSMHTPWPASPRFISMQACAAPTTPQS
jgi:tagatose-1,6-bisphosphate aldolase non-catalytic subunit AgaZ/GatZ